MIISSEGPQGNEETKSNKNGRHVSFKSSLADLEACCGYQSPMLPVPQGEAYLICQKARGSFGIHMELVGASRPDEFLP